nr:hypothetical protein [Tanacetum cinerariifolium]
MPLFDNSDVNTILICSSSAYPSDDVRIIRGHHDDGVGNVTDVGNENVKMKTMAVIIAITDDRVSNVTDDGIWSSAF